MLKKKLLVGAALAVGLLGAASGVRADTFAYYVLTTSNGSPSTDLTGFAQVAVDLSANGKVAIITFNALGAYNFVGPDLVGVNVNTAPGAFTLSNFSGTSTPGVTYTGDTSNGNMDGYGKFNAQVSGSSGNSANPPITFVSFTVTDTASWGTVGNVLAGNAHSPGEIAAAHMYPLTGQTGYVSDASSIPTPVTNVGGTPIPTPLPKSAWAGLALLGMLGLRRKARAGVSV